MIKKRVGVVGYGHLGRFLVEKILSQDDLSLAFVWNRTVSAFGSEVPAECILTDLENFTEKCFKSVEQNCWDDVQSMIFMYLAECIHFLSPLMVEYILVESVYFHCVRQLFSCEHGEDIYNVPPEKIL